MTDMTAFERRVADGMLRRAGAVRPVDDLAVYEAVAAARRSRSWGLTMFNALKYVAAGVIVALFGGFLLAGMFTTQPVDEMAPAAATESPSTTAEATVEPTDAPTTSVRTDILPGVTLTVEEVEPGVFHVLGDGVRDLHSGPATDIVAGHDDGIWLLRKNRFFRLGADVAQAWPTEGSPKRTEFEVAPDGTVWVIQADSAADEWSNGILLSSADEGWSDDASTPTDAFDVEIAPDGTIWASWGADADAEVGYLGPTGWQALDLGEERSGAIFVTDAGDLFGIGCGYGCWLNHYQDGAWQVFLVNLGVTDVGPDGTVWHLGALRVLDYTSDAPATGATGVGLARFADGEWTWWSNDDLPFMGLGIALDDGHEVTLLHEFRVAPDRALWASLWQKPEGDTGPDDGLWNWAEREGAAEGAVCDGVVRFDGETIDRFLPGQCISMDIAADGSVWVLTGADEGRDLYVITPEAVPDRA